MISIEQWRCAIGQYCPKTKCISFQCCSGAAGASFIIELMKSLPNWFVVHVCSDRCMNGVIYLSIMLLLLSGDVETNPGPTQQVCPKCSALVNFGKTICDCGYNFRDTPAIKSKRKCPMKQCPSCHTCLHSRRVLCECGYDFKKLVLLGDWSLMLNVEKLVWLHCGPMKVQK